MATTRPPLTPQEPDSGVHPHAPDDTPAARGMLGIILALLVVCSIIAVIVYNAYHEPENEPPRSEQPDSPAPAR